VFSELARTWLPIVAAVDFLIVLPLLAISVVMALVLRPKRAGWLGYSAAIGVGFALGYLVLGTEARPALRVGILIAIVGLAVATMLVTGRTTLGGVLLIAAAAPWLLFDVAILADVALLGRRMIDPSGTVISLIFAVVTAGIGVSLVRFPRPWDVRHPRPPEPPPADPAERHWDVVSRLTFGTDRLLSPPIVGSLAAVLLGAEVTATVAHGRPPLEVVVLGSVGALVSAAGYALGFALVRTPRSRRALEPFVGWPSRSSSDLAGWPAARSSSVPGRSAATSGTRRSDPRTAGFASMRWSRPGTSPRLGPWLSECPSARHSSASNGPPGKPCSSGWEGAPSTSMASRPRSRRSSPPGATSASEPKSCWRPTASACWQATGRPTRPNPSELWATGWDIGGGGHGAGSWAASSGAGSRSRPRSS